jgi:hypothetical protein
MGDAKSSLGDAESSLGDAKSSLGDAKSSMGDAKSSLRARWTCLLAQSKCGWWRVDEDGARSLISDHTVEAGGNFYESTVEDYGYNLVFGFTPVRVDGAVGDTVFAQETGVIFPPPPVVHEVVVTVRARPPCKVLSMLHSGPPPKCGEHMETPPLTSPNVALTWLRARVDMLSPG